MPLFIHEPVLLEEAVAKLAPARGGRYVDGTLGGGGHAAEILKRSAPDGRLFGCDRDGEALRATEQRLALFQGRFELRQCAFSELAGWVEQGSCEGVMLDLGVSSPQFDKPERGFSFQAGGPLDMRMDRRQPLTAATLVNSAEVEELARIFRDWGGVRQSRRLASRIVQQRQIQLIETTTQLSELVERVFPRRSKRHPATKVFQALRIAVNDEMEQLRNGLASLWPLLRPGGRLAVITFHSGEDRLVKQFGRAMTRDYDVMGEVDLPEFRLARKPRAKWVNRKAIQPSDVELARNPRSRSAQLRVLDKLN